MHQLKRAVVLFGEGAHELGQAEAAVALGDDADGVDGDSARAVQSGDRAGDVRGLAVGQFAEARRLIVKHGSLRRMEELEKAENALLGTTEN